MVILSLCDRYTLSITGWHLLEGRQPASIVLVFHSSTTQRPCGAQISPLKKETDTLVQGQRWIDERNTGLTKKYQRDFGYPVYVTSNQSSLITAK